MSFVDLRPNIENMKKYIQNTSATICIFICSFPFFAFSIMFMEYIKCIEYSGSQYYCYYYYCPPPSLCLSVSVGRKQTRIVSAVATLSQNNPTWHTVQNEPFTNDVDAMVYIYLILVICTQRKPDMYGICLVLVICSQRKLDIYIIFLVLVICTQRKPYIYVRVQ